MACPARPPGKSHGPCLFCPRTAKACRPWASSRSNDPSGSGISNHAPTLIYRCRPTSSPWPDDTAALSLLADAVIDAETLIDEIVHGGSVSSQERNARAWPAIETWLTDGEIFLRQAHVSAPHRRPVLPVTASTRSLTTGRPAHRSH